MTCDRVEQEKQIVSTLVKHSSPNIHSYLFFCQHSFIFFEPIFCIQMYMNSLILPTRNDSLFIVGTSLQKATCIRKKYDNRVHTTTGNI